MDKKCALPLIPQNPHTHTTLHENISINKFICYKKLCCAQLARFQKFCNHEKSVERENWENVWLCDDWIPYKIYIYEEKKTSSKKRGARGREREGSQSKEVK